MEPARAVELTWSAAFTLSAELTSSMELTQPFDEGIHLLLSVSSRDRYPESFAAARNGRRADGDHPETCVEQFLLRLQRCL